MKRAYFRSILFNILFYLSTLLACLALLPTLVLPRSAFMWVVHLWLAIVVFLEKYVMGLTYEIRGKENLPESGSYIVAAKHQSAYETMKLHPLFGDPAIVLKKELLMIPLWGWFLKKSDVIAIDRSSPKTANESLIAGARHIQAAGRPIVIFPQGTRVPPHVSTKEKPYKMGVTRIQEATDLPIIPVATNTGMFWPRSGFFKSPGKVVFDILKPIPPGGKKDETIKALEQQIEERSFQLMEEAKNNQKTPSPLPLVLSLVVLTGLCAGYYYIWMTAAEQVKRAYIDFSNNIKGASRIHTPPEVTGFPFEMVLSVEEDRIENPEGSVEIHDIEARGWPIPGADIDITTGPITIEYHRWKAPLKFESMTATVDYMPDVLTLHENELIQNDFKAGLTGEIDFSQQPVPEMDLELHLDHHHAFVDELVKNKMLNKNAGMLASTVISSFANQDGEVEVPITQKKRNLYVGPIKVWEIP